MKKILTLVAVLLIIAMLPFTLFSCNGGGGNGGSSSSSSSTPANNNKDDEKPALEGTAYKLIDNLDKLKINGRHLVTKKGIACDDVGSGIEFSGTMKGKVYLTVAEVYISGNTKAAYYTIYIDGKRQDERITAKQGRAAVDLVIADFGETEGEHHIRVVKQTEARYARGQFITLTIDGTLGAKPADKEHFIEFVGSDLICGMGNYNGTPDQEPSVAQTAEYEDGTQSMSFLTAEHFGADCSILGVSGMGVASSWFPPLNAPSYYKAAAYYRDKDAQYDFNNARTPDVIVLNIGKNDGQDLPEKPTDLEFMAAARSFLTFLREAHGDKVKIVWTYDLYDECKMSMMESIIESLGGESAGIYICKVYSNKLGGQKHTDLDGHKKSAEDLIKFIEEKKLLTDAPVVDDKLEWDESDIIKDEISLAYAENTAMLKHIGRTMQLSTGLAADHVASGISFRGVFKDEVKLTLKCTAKRDDELVLAVFVDGKRIQDTYVDGKRTECAFRLSAGEHTITLADFETAGEHTITVLKQTESGYALLELNKLSFTGFISEKKPEDNKKYIEFIGDSLTCGMGSAGNSTINSAQGMNGADWEDGTLSYAYLTAQMLKTDYSIISESGIGLADTWFTSPMGGFYSATSYNRNSSMQFDFSSARVPDVVVINMGTNDYYLSRNNGHKHNYQNGELRAAIEAFIRQVKTAYGEDTKIVWVSGVWADPDVSEINSVISELGGEASGIYRLHVNYSDENRKGAESHPSAVGQQGVADQLYAYLVDNDLV